MVFIRHDTHFRTKRPKKFNGRAALGSIKPPEVPSSGSGKQGRHADAGEVPQHAHRCGANDTWSFQLNAAHSVKMQLCI